MGKYPISKLVKSKPTLDGGRIDTYRHPIIMGMQFTYLGTKRERMHHVGYYDYVIAVTPDEQTLSEKKLPNVFFTTPKTIHV